MDIKKLSTKILQKSALQLDKIKFGDEPDKWHSCSFYTSTRQKYNKAKGGLDR